MDHLKWPKIYAPKNTRRGIQKWTEATGNPFPVVRYAPKLKLHGTNAGVQIPSDKSMPIRAQGRNVSLTPQADNFGFARWLVETEDVSGVFETLRDPMHDSVVFAEWAGKGINGGDAITQVPRKVLCVYAIVVGDQALIDPTRISNLIYQRYGKAKTNELGIYVLPWYDSPVELDYGSAKSIADFEARYTAHVADLDKVDPWVQSTFGVSGHGEGLVYYPLVGDYDTTGCVPFEALSHFMFKVKGESHAVNKGKKKSQNAMSPDKLNSIQEFVDAYVTEPRLLQGVTEACEGQYDFGKIRNIVQWVGRDVKSESMADLESNGLTWKDVSKFVTAAAVKWYKDQI
tara:strand:+ start:3641 stop:4672 length:1032 start_codon:yes stop_codon:yes gene_type:complete